MTTFTFRKDDPSVATWVKTGSFSVATGMDIYISVNGLVKKIDSGTPIEMPESPQIGSDYVIWYSSEFGMGVSSYGQKPPNTKKLGGFHYAPGGNADDRRVGGDDTPSINEYSFWDLNFRPDGNDPRGMTLVDNSFWVDIYLLNADHINNGTSKYNTRIADGRYNKSGYPLIPFQNGGDGKSRYDGLNYYQALEILESHGKRMVTESEFAQLAYGTTENISGNTDPVDSILRKEFTSKWGVMLSTGNMWIWGQDAALFGAFGTPGRSPARVPRVGTSLPRSRTSTSGLAGPMTT